MRELSSRFWNLFRRHRQTKSRTRATTKSRWRPTFELLEGRLTPATSGFLAPSPGVVSGLVYLNPQNTGVFQTGDTVVPGATVNLVGTTTQGTAVNSTTTTDANGSFKFFQVQAGTYSLTANTGAFVGGKASIGNLGGQGGNTVSLISVSEGQAGINYNLAVRGFSVGFVSLRQFLSTSKHTLDSSAFPAAGSGITSVDNTVQPQGAPVPGTASLAGSVQDTSSAAVKGLQVNLTGIDDTGRDIFLTTTTDSSGAYSFSTLQSGTYTLNVNAQPAGFRAGTPSVGSLGGLVFQNDQIIKIPVATGSKGTGYKFQEISVPTGSGVGPIISAALADDTAGPGGTASDGITSDPSVLGKIANASAITSFSAGFDSTSSASFTSVLDNLKNDGTFSLNRALLGHVAGGTLADGIHTLHLLATNGPGQSSSFDVTFTLKNTAPTVPTVHLDSTSDPGQIGRTTATTVTIQGQTSAGVQVALIQGTTTKTTTADSSGAYSFSNISLAAGSNNFTVQASDNAGNISQHLASFVRQSAPVAVPAAPVQISLGKNGPDRFVDLSSPTIFTDPNSSDTIVRFNTTAGPLDLELFDTVAPQTVANFLSYIQSGKYTNDVFHRLDTSPPVLQGGGFTFNTTTNNVDTLTPGPNVPNEFSQANSNVAGTIAMAKQGGNQNSANSQFFFNLGDNSVTLNAANNGGFTVFGKVRSGQDQRVLNTLAAFGVKDETAFNAAFNVFPLQNYSGTNFPHDATLNNFAAITSASVLQQSDQLTYSIVSNSSPGIVTATIVQGQLQLHPTGTGTASIVVKATNLGGQTANVTFAVTVGPIGLANPGNQTDLEGDSVSLATTATHTGSAALTFSATGLPDGLSIDPTSGMISGTISSGAHTSSPFTTTVTASDGTNSASQTFNWTVFSGVTVTSVPNQTNKEGDTVSVPVSAKAVNNGALTFTANNLPNGLNIDPTTGLITGTIAAGAAASSPFITTITATQGALSGTTLITWTVNPVVTMNSISAQTNLEGDKPSLQVAATDVNNKPLTFSATGLPTGLAINTSTGLISGTISAGASKASPFQAVITATDGTFSASRTVTWNVNPVVSVSPIQNRSNAEGDTITPVQVTATDANNKTVTFSATHLPTGLQIDTNTGVISGTVSLGAATGSPYSVQVTGTDGTFSDTQTFTWLIHT
jgi:cyclophilin family peptidyl-prolyl cis-trans isomerase